jgi:hypothetical protein
MSSVAFKASLVSFLESVTALSSLISDRIYSSIAKQNPNTPYIVYNTVGSDEQYCHDGPVLEEFRIQFDIYAHSVLECEQVRDALKTALSGKSEVMGTVNLGYCFFNNIELDGYEQKSELYRKTLDFKFKLNQV